jgi:tetratricopeptide (TPR) repeat protein
MDSRQDLERIEDLISSGDLAAARCALSQISGAATEKIPHVKHSLMLLEARILAAEGDYERSRRAVMGVFEEARAGGDRVCTARCHLLLSHLLLRLSDYALAKEHAEAAVYFCLWEIDDSGLHSDALNNLGLAKKNLGLWDVAQRDFASALRVQSGVKDPARVLRISQNLAILLRKMGRVGEAESMCREGLHLSTDLGMSGRACRCALELGNISVIKRDAVECGKYIAIGQAIAGEKGYSRERVLANEIRGDSLLASGDARGALQAYTAGLDLGRDLGVGSDVEIELLRRVAHVHSVLGATAEARSFVEKALSLAESTHDTYEHAACLRVLGEIEMAEGVEGTGIEHLRKSVDELSKLSLGSHELAVSEMVLGKALAYRSDAPCRADALEHLFVARRVFSGMGVSAAVREVDEIVAAMDQSRGSDRNPAPRGGKRDQIGDLRGRIDIGAYGIVTGDTRIAGDLTRWGGSDTRVLIEGETGVGKELIARAMHAMGKRREEQFVAVDCGALSETLAESELFGHARGAFTGSIRDRVGLIEAANGGTLFLDEVGELSEALQSKLLRALENKEVRRVGENRTRPVDVRVLSATTKDLSAEVEAGHFRRDLYYRLKAVVVRVPSLRERRGDVELLVDHFLEMFNEREGKDVRLVGEARKVLLEYDWPGNVRELRQVVEALVVSVGDGETVDAAGVTEFLEASGSGARPGSGLDTVEDREIRRALEVCGGNKAEAARLLGISRKTLYRRMRDLSTK